MSTAASRDPGLQPERTTLSWTRTAAGLLLNAVLNLRSGYVHDSVPLLVLSGALVVAAAAVFSFGRLRRRQLSARSASFLRNPPQLSARRRQRSPTIVRFRRSFDWRRRSGAYPWIRRIARSQHSAS